MGVNIRDIIVSKEISLNDLAGKRVAFDAYNVLYQFLSAIRQRDGSLLQDSNGRVTSHLSGLFYRIMNLLEAGVKPVFVFDGVAPDLKKETQDSRRKIKEGAQEKYDKALAEGDEASARKYAQQTSFLTKEMVSEAKELIRAMGLPIVQAIAEGESQAAYIAKKAMAYGVASQDYDSLLFGTPFLIRNLSISGRKKLPGRDIYTEVKPEIIALADVLNTLGIDIDQLIEIAVLIGTDYNVGIKGIGSKKALEVIKSNKQTELLSKIPRAKQVISLFKNPAVSTGITLSWSKMDVNKIKQILCERHEFSEMRINNAVERLIKKQQESKQTDLSFFG